MATELTAEEIKQALAEQGDGISDSGFEAIAKRLAQPDEVSAVDIALSFLDDHEGYTPTAGTEDIED